MSEYIAGVQLSREQIRAKNKETLMELINNGQIPDTEKQAAIQSMIRMTSEYIAGVQLSREQIRAKNKETLMELINNGQIPDTEKQAAIQSMIRMTEISSRQPSRV